MEILDDDFIEPSKSSIRLKAYKIFIILILIGFPIATLLSWWEVESIVGSGPTLSTLGIVGIVLSSTFKNKTSVILASIPVVVSLIWLSLISLLGLSPGDVKFTVPISLTTITAIYLIWGLIHILNLKK